MRKQIVTFVPLFLIACLTSAGRADSVQVDAVPSYVVKLGEEVQLFVSNDRIADLHAVERKIHPAKKLPSPVLEPEKPWEGCRVYIYGTVHFDPAEKIFKMWYMSAPTKGKRDKSLKRGGAIVNYATSKDGIKWEKPNLGVHSYNGSKDTNIVSTMDSPSIIVDTADPDPARRYKMLGMLWSKKYEDKKAYLDVSPDGIHWTQSKDEPLFLTNDTVTWMRDPFTGEYVSFHKRDPMINGFHRRSVYLTTSRDLKKWTPSRLIVAADKIDDAWAKGPKEHTEFYDMSGFPYGDQFLGMITTFRVKGYNKKPAPGQSPIDGPIYAELVYSRDGRDWRRMDDRTPIIENGPGAYDAGCILGMANSLVIHNDEIWLYYTAITTTHGGAMPEKRITIGRASWRLDGFVSLDAGKEKVGTVETVTLDPTGDQLSINADVKKGGYVKVEVLDANGKTLPGYAKTDCVPMTTDSIRHAITWKNHSRLPSDQPIRLRFHLWQASLYSYKIQ